MKVLFDTDVCLDFILQRQPFFSESEKIFNLAAARNFDGFVSAITPLNIYYIARKQYGDGKTRLEIANLLQLVKVCSVNQQHLTDDVSSAIKDYEDAVQNESAEAENLNAIVTRNTKDFADSNLKIYTPKSIRRRNFCR